MTYLSVVALVDEYVFYFQISVYHRRRLRVEVVHSERDVLDHPHLPQPRDVVPRHEVFQRSVLHVLEQNSVVVLLEHDGVHPHDVLVGKVHVHPRFVDHFRCGTDCNDYYYNKLFSLLNEMKASCYCLAEVHILSKCYIDTVGKFRILNIFIRTRQKYTIQ